MSALVVAEDPKMMAWIDGAAHDLRWSVHLIETIFDPQTVILTSGAPEALARRLVEAMHPLLPSIADRPGRACRACSLAPPTPGRSRSARPRRRSAVPSIRCSRRS